MEAARSEVDDKSVVLVPMVADIRNALSTLSRFIVHFVQAGSASMQSQCHTVRVGLCTLTVSFHMFMTIIAAHHI